MTDDIKNGLGMVYNVTNMYHLSGIYLLGPRHYKSSNLVKLKKSNNIAIFESLISYSIQEWKCVVRENKPGLRFAKIDESCCFFKGHSK